MWDAHGLSEKRHEVGTLLQELLRERGEVCTIWRSVRLSTHIGRWSTCLRNTALPCGISAPSKERCVVSLWIHRQCDSRSLPLARTLSREEDWIRVNQESHSSKCVKLDLNTRYCILHAYICLRIDRCNDLVLFNLLDHISLYLSRRSS